MASSADAPQRLTRKAVNAFITKQSEGVRACVRVCVVTRSLSPVRVHPSCTGMSEEESCQECREFGGRHPALTHIMPCSYWWSNCSIYQKENGAKIVLRHMLLLKLLGRKLLWAYFIKDIHVGLGLLLQLGFRLGLFGSLFRVRDRVR